MEKLVETEDFTNPKFYSEVFKDFLEKSSDLDLNYVQWLTTISCYTQVMKTEIGAYFQENTREQIDSFVKSSLDKKPLDIETSKVFLQEMIYVLEEI